MTNDSTTMPSTDSRTTWTFEVLETVSEWRYQ